MKLAEFDYLLETTIKALIGLHNALPETTDPRLKEIGEQYGISIVTDVGNEDGEITFSPLSEHDKTVVADLLEFELSAYSPEAIKACHLKRLIACTELRDGGRPVNGIAEVGRFLLDSLILNTKAIRHDWLRTRGTFHHELFHAIDYRDDVEHYLDGEWRKLNGAGYKYNDALQFTAGAVYSNSAYCPPFDFTDLEQAPAGFLTTYGTQSVHEDKAVFYSWLLVRYGEVMKLGRKDPVILAKAERMKELLYKFHPSFDDKFWHKISQRCHVLGDAHYDTWQSLVRQHREQL